MIIPQVVLRVAWKADCGFTTSSLWSKKHITVRKRNFFPPYLNPVRFCIDVDLMGSVVQCEMLQRSNILAIVSGGSRPKFADNTLLIYDDVSKKFILELTFSSSIKAVRLRKDKYVHCG